MTDAAGWPRNQTAVYGFDEASAAEGLQAPFHLPFNTTLFGTKKCRADYGHHGEMSLWQTYGVFG